MNVSDYELMPFVLSRGDRVSVLMKLIRELIGFVFVFYLFMYFVAFVSQCTLFFFFLRLQENVEYQQLRVRLIKLIVVRPFCWEMYFRSQNASRYIPPKTSTHSKPREATVSIGTHRK